MGATSRLGRKADRAKFIRPTLCRMAAGWRSGRTPAEPYPPADDDMVTEGPVTSQAAARGPPIARPASSKPQWLRSPGAETKADNCNGLDLRLYERIPTDWLVLKRPRLAGFEAPGDTRGRRE
jgi:hypothetical protein